MGTSLKNLGVSLKDLGDSVNEFCTNPDSMIVEYCLIDVEFTKKLVESMHEPWYVRIWHRFMELIGRRRRFKIIIVDYD